MKKLLHIRGVVVVLAALTAGAIGAGMLFRHHEQHAERDAEARAFATESMWAIAGKWDPNAMLTRADPAIVNTYLREQLPNAYARLAVRYGTLQQLGPLTGQTDAGGATISPYTVHSMPGEPESVGTWSADARFTHGPARIELVMRRHGDGWKLLGFRLEPAGPVGAAS